MSTIINLFGGPGIGKSSIAAGLVYKLKRKHISCDAPYEFPKALAWDNNGVAIKDQFDSQTYPTCLYGKEFDDLIIFMNNYYSSLNIVLKRSEEGIHNDKERYQNLEDSIHLDNAIKAKLEEFQIPYIEVDVNKNTVNKILELIGQ